MLSPSACGRARAYEAADLGATLCQSAVARCVSLLCRRRAAGVRALYRRK